MSAVQRTRLTVRYDGTGFAGSQIQPARGGKTPRTVSGTLTDELTTLLGYRPHLLWASRTDSGVHAEGNVCTFEGAVPMPLEALTKQLNVKLTPEVHVREAAVVKGDWHPRFDAEARKYVYRVWRGEAAPYDKQRYVHAHDGDWDGPSVQVVLDGLCGTRDCGALSRKPTRGGTVCTISRAEQIENGSEVQWHVTANRFLWRMMCNLAGLLLLVAGGTVGREAALEVVREGRRRPIKPASAQGLVLWEIYYA